MKVKSEDEIAREMAEIMRAEIDNMILGLHVPIMPRGTKVYFERVKTKPERWTPDAHDRTIEGKAKVLAIEDPAK